MNDKNKKILGLQKKVRNLRAEVKKSKADQAPIVQKEITAERPKRVTVNAEFKKVQIFL